MLSIKQFASAVNKSEVYIRRLVLQGKLPSTKTMIPGTNIPRHQIHEDEVGNFMVKNKRVRRDDGRNRLILHSTPEELQKLVKWLDEQEDIAPIISKPKYYKK